MTRTRPLLPASRPGVQVRAVDIGHLVKIKGIVTRVSDVKPMLTVRLIPLAMRVRRG